MPSRWLQFSLRTLLVVMTLACVAVAGKRQYDWYQRRALIARWVEPLVKQAHLPVKAEWGQVELPPLPPAPAGVESETETGLLKTGVLDLETSVQRHAALRILVETQGAESLPALRDLARHSRHPDTTATLLHLIALAKDPGDLPLLERLLDDSSAEVRGAAAESIGYIYQPAYGFAHGWQMSGSQIFLNTQPVIDARELDEGNRRQSDLFRKFLSGDNRQDENRELKKKHRVDPATAAEAWRVAEKKRQSQVPPRLRGKIENQMLGGPTLAEREAAARGLVPWPPDNYQLRVAEWGVWIDAGDKLHLTDEVLDEIPPFVHRTGNAIGSLARNRFDGPVIITKPIIHVTADRPLAVDLEVAIASGRPWFAYPRPDGFIVSTSGSPYGLPQLTESVLKDLEPSGLEALESVSEGYPWVHPAVRSAGESRARYGPRDRITSIGVRWQSLIVTPTREPWMKPPEVPDEARFGWWEALREVPSAWVSSQEEAERFLYYDGPTLGKSPHQVVLEPAELAVTPRNTFWELYKDVRSRLGGETRVRFR